MSENEKDKKETSQKRPTSQRKVEANRANAQRSTGPKTEAGKRSSAQNAYKHGFFANRLFPTRELCAEDLEQYEMIHTGLISHYAPEGFLEHFWIEKMATEALRTARVLGHGQKVLGYQNPFETKSIDKLLRYESTVSRNFANAQKMLDRLQAERRARPPDGSIDPEAHPTPRAPEPSSCSTTPEPTGTSAQEVEAEENASPAGAAAPVGSAMESAGTESATQAGLD